MKMIIEFSGMFADRKEFRYGSRNLKPGDEFDCEDKDVVTLTAAGIAVPARIGASRPPRQYPEAATSAPAAPAPERKPRAYRRRDLKAE